MCVESLSSNSERRNQAPISVVPVRPLRSLALDLEKAVSVSKSPSVKRAKISSLQERVFAYPEGLTSFQRAYFVGERVLAATVCSYLN